MIFAGKAHPNDTDGKRLIRQIHDYAKTLKDQINIVYLENYNMDIAAKLTSGVDVWLNTPLPPSGSLRNQRHESRPQWRRKLQCPRRLVDGRMHRRRDRLGNRPSPKRTVSRKRKKRSRNPRPLQQTRIPNRSNILQAKRCLDNTHEKLHRKNSLPTSRRNGSCEDTSQKPTSSKNQHSQVLSIQRTKQKIDCRLAIGVL